MADFEEMVPSPLSVEEEDELWTGMLKILLKLVQWRVRRHREKRH